MSAYASRVRIYPRSAEVRKVVVSYVYVGDLVSHSRDEAMPYVHHPKDLENSVTMVDRSIGNRRRFYIFSVYIHIIRIPFIFEVSCYTTLPSVS